MVIPRHVGLAAGGFGGVQVQVGLTKIASVSTTVTSICHSAILNTCVCFPINVPFIGTWCTRTRSTFALGLHPTIVGFAAGAKGISKPDAFGG
jgi:hypothetical protein